MISLNYSFIRSGTLPNWSMRKSLLLCNKPMRQLFHFLFSTSELTVYYDSQIFINKGWLVNTIVQSMKDQYKQNWHSEMEKSLCYLLFKQKLEFGSYFNILETKEIVELCKFRTSYYELHIEQGRSWQISNVKKESANYAT